MKTLQLGILAAAVAGMVALIGCESLTAMGASLVDQHMGDAVEANIALQTENPTASYDNTESPRIDPDTAAVVMDRYFETQTQAEPKYTPSIIQFSSE